MEKTTKVDKQYLANIRHELHEDICSAVSNTEHKALMIVREPNSSRKQSAPKMIIVVGTDEQAEELKNKCLNLIERANSNIRNELKESISPRYEVRYSVNTIHSAGNVALSIHSAQRRRKMLGSEVRKKLEQIKSTLNSSLSVVKCEDIAVISNYIDKCMGEIRDTSHYILAEATGSSYRVTYFNGEFREQISVGNLLIVVSSEDIQIVDAPARKQRADKKEYLYYLNDGFGEIYIYPA